MASFPSNFVNSSHEIGFRWSAGLFVRHKPGKFICGADAVEVDYEIGSVDKHRDLRQSLARFGECLARASIDKGSIGGRPTNRTIARFARESSLEGEPTLAWRFANVVYPDIPGATCNVGEQQRTLIGDGLGEPRNVGVAEVDRPQHQGVRPRAELERNESNDDRGQHGSTAKYGRASQIE